MDILKYKIHIEYLDDDGNIVVCKQTISSDGTNEFCVISPNFRFSSTLTGDYLTYGYLKNQSGEFEFRIKYDLKGNLSHIDNLSASADLDTTLGSVALARSSKQVKTGQSYLRALQKNELKKLQPLRYYLKEIYLKQKKSITYSEGEKYGSDSKGKIFANKKELFYKVGDDGIIEIFDNDSNKHSFFMHIMSRQFELSSDEFEEHKKAKKVSPLIKKAEAIKSKALNLESLLENEKKINAEILEKILNEQFGSSSQKAK